MKTLLCGNKQIQKMTKKEIATQIGINANIICLCDENRISDTESGLRFEFDILGERFLCTCVVEKIAVKPCQFYIQVSNIVRQ